MKKIIVFIFAFFLSLGNAFAEELIDVPADFWAVKEIVYCIREGIISAYPGSIFKPEDQVKRAEFNSMLLRTLGHKQIDSADSNKFKDINDSYWAYADILKSVRLGLLYGYPDKSFKPEEYITKAEVASIISHITKNDVKDISILNQFSDSNTIPVWAKKQYAKAVELGIYVNYPEMAFLLPNKVLNRAEAAVILYRLRMAMGLVQEKYVAREIVTGTEHLRIESGAPNNKITITNYRKIVQAGNVIRVNFAEPFNSKRLDVGKTVKFNFVDDVVTEEGSVLIPKGSTASAVISVLDKQRAFNKNAKVALTFNEIGLPSGQNIQISGRVFQNDGILTATKMATFGKVAGYTAGGLVVGAGAGVSGSAMASPHNWGTGMAIGLPVGAGVGLLTGLITPGLPYKANTKDSILVEITEDFSITESDNL